MYSFQMYHISRDIHPRLPMVFPLLIFPTKAESAVAISVCCVAVVSFIHMPLSYIIPCQPMPTHASFVFWLHNH